MKELTLHEMENVSGAGIIGMTVELTNFTVKSAMGLISAGIETSMHYTGFLWSTTLDLANSVFSSSSLSNLGSTVSDVITDNWNSFDYAKSGAWSRFATNAATDWGMVTTALHR